MQLLHKVGQLGDMLCKGLGMHPAGGVLLTGVQVQSSQPQAAQQFQ